jgi:hypothetical protein
LPVSGSRSTSTRLHLVEQAHVLDRDHRLIGEGGDQFDLFFGERLHLVASQINGADRRALPQQGDGEDGPVAHLSSVGTAFRIFLRLRLKIRHMDRPPLQQGTSAGRAAYDGDRVSKRRRERPIMGAYCQSAILELEDPYVFGTAENCGGLDQRVEHRLKIEFRAADNLENVGGGRLLLQGFSQLA